MQHLWGICSGVYQFLIHITFVLVTRNISTVELYVVLRVLSRRSHLYQGHKKLNSVRPLNSKSQAVVPATDKWTCDNSSENKSVMINKVECERKQSPSVFRKASATNADQMSKWSRFFSSDATDDGSVISSQSVSDFVDEDTFPVMHGCSNTNILPSTSVRFYYIIICNIPLRLVTGEVDFRGQQFIQEGGGNISQS